MGVILSHSISLTIKVSSGNFPQSLGLGQSQAERPECTEIVRLVKVLTMQIKAIVATKTAGVYKLEPKLVSYITSKYKTKSDMTYDKTLWAEIIEIHASALQRGGCCLPGVISTVKQKEGSFILANTWKYVDEEAFVACQELFREAEAELAKRFDIPQIITAPRSVILEDVHP